MNFANLKEWTTPKGNVVELAINGKIAWKKGTAIGSLPVGSIVYTTVESRLTEFLIVQQGLPSSAYDSSCDGTWLLMSNAYVCSDYVWDAYDEDDDEGPYNDYGNSQINGGLNGYGFVSKLKTELQKIIKTVKIPYRPGYGTSKTVASGANGHPCYAFLLSYTELGFSGDSYAPVEGAVLDYFADATDSNFKRVFDPFKYGNGKGVNWWLRTPDTSGSNQAWRVGYFYNSGKYLYGRADREIVDSTIPFFRPAFIIPSDTLVDDSFNIVV